jgi:hypothetical protein
MEIVIINWGDKLGLMKFNRFCNTIEENLERDKKTHGGCSSEEEHLIVVQDVVGSSPIIHPTLECSSVGLER